MAKSNKERHSRYRFLHDHIAKEAYIFDILDVISDYQETVLREGSGELATLENLKKSRAIKMPFTPTRNKNISYLVELLLKNYPDDVRAVVSFDFTADQESKKLEIIENKEITVSMKNEDYNKFQEIRDLTSLENLNKLLLQFRLFNLTKLLRKTQNKNDLSRVIKIDLGNNIFTFKHYKIDRNTLELSEDYSFHKNNYESVKKSLDMAKLKEIVSAHSNPILRRLKNFGILNTTFNDYRDSKLDYLLNILMDDLASTIGPKDLTEVKNFESLRSCILKVDKLIDPLITVSNDIAKYIRENGICRESDILALFETIDYNALKTWEETSFDKFKILSTQDERGETKLIDGRILLPRITDLHQLILFKTDIFNQMDHNEKQSKINDMELLCSAGKYTLSYQDRALALLSNEENIKSLKTIIQDFADYKKRTILKTTIEEDYQERRRKRTFIEVISSFFKSLFGKSRVEEIQSSVSTRGGSGMAKRTRFSRQTRDLYNRVKTHSGKIIPLSDYIELTSENELRIDTVINEIRGNNLKIVIPIYNARSALYPNRSQKYLIPSVEYLLVNPDVIQTAEAVRAFTDSLVGEKLKDEIIPGNGIMAIEKYLLTLYRQKRAINLKKARAGK